MIGPNVELAAYLTVLDWQEPGWRLNGPVTHCGGLDIM